MQESVILADDRDPWDRQCEETPKRYAQFLAFRDLGRTRTLTKAAENLTLSYGHLRHVAAAGMWHPRATAWDNYLNRIYAAELVDARRAAAQADAELANEMRSRITAALARIGPDDLDPGHIATWFRVILSARDGLYGDDLATAMGGPALAPADLADRLLAGYDSPPAQSIAEAKTLELRRLDRLQCFLWPAAAAGDIPAVRAIERLMAARARLLGLNSAAKVEKVTKSELDAELERLLSAMPLDLPPAPRDDL